MNRKLLPPLPVKTGPDRGTRAFSDEQEDAILTHVTSGRRLEELAAHCRTSVVTIRAAIKRAQARLQPRPEEADRAQANREAS